jgi:predicted nucleotidyltransferase
LNIRHHILAALAYFDLFNYPITLAEISYFLPENYRQSEIESAINELLQAGKVYQCGEFFSLQNNATLADRRVAGNEKARKMLQSAKKVAVLISYFPFVRGVAVSGSLSKNFADDKSDIDLFIITAANRLWIARSVLHLLKKVSFLFNRQHYFCMNYFVDEAQLTIEEKNIYTATEVATLLPLTGAKTFNGFYTANRWVKEFLPNYLIKISASDIKRFSWIQRTSEAILNNKFADKIEKRLMRITAKRWNHKSVKGSTNSKGLLMSMRASEHCAKPDPSVFQQRLLKRYELKLESLQEYKLSKVFSAY